MTIAEKDSKFYDLVAEYISTYSIREDTAFDMVKEELGYRPRYSQESEDC